MQTDGSGNPNHIAVYIGNEMILHHGHGRLSRRDIYGGFWQKHTTHHLRHKTKC
jgi:cell wall-associated NlpC family hydrolase